MITMKQGLKMSAIIDKLEIKITNPEASSEQVGADLLMQIVTKAHKAENEIIAFVAEMKKCSVEDAENVDLIAFIKEIANDSGMKDFFKSAVTQSVRE